MKVTQKQPITCEIERLVSIELKWVGNNAAEDDGQSVTTSRNEPYGLADVTIAKATPVGASFPQKSQIL